MAISRFKTSTLAQGLPKYQKLWDGTSVVIPTTGYVALATQTVGSGGVSSITFSGIPQTFKHLQIRAVAKGSANAVYDRIDYRFNGDSGANYYRNLMLTDGSIGITPDTYYYTNQTFGAAVYVTGSTAPSTLFGGIVIDILDYTNTSKHKTVRSFGGVNNNTSTGYLAFTGAGWGSTAAITSITLGPLESGNNLTQYSSFALYGIQG